MFNPSNFLGSLQLLMPSFEEVMRKSEQSFEKIMPSLFKEFSNNKECGILLCKINTTLVYCFDDGKLHLWYFTEQNDKSVFKFYVCFTSVNDHIGVAIAQTIIKDAILFKGTLEERERALASLGNFVATYIAVKRYIKVETVVIPVGKYTLVEGTPLEYVDNKKVINNTGQQVVVMDSKWFRKIVNDNEIYVRGFWRFQNKKNEFGKWYKELIFIKPFYRNGYHRNAKIEEMESRDKFSLNMD